MVWAGYFNMRGYDGKRRQQAWQQGSEKAQAGKAESPVDGELGRGRTRVSGCQEAQVGTVRGGRDNARPSPVRR